MDISNLSDKNGRGWEKCGAAGTQTIALQDIDMKAGSLVVLTETAPNMAIYSHSKRLSIQKNTCSLGHFVYPEERSKSAAMVPTVLEEDIGERITALPATPENVQSVRGGAGCHGGIEGVYDNGIGVWYYPPPDPDEFDRGKWERKLVGMIIEDVVDTVL